MRPHGSRLLLVGFGSRYIGLHILLNFLVNCVNVLLSQSELFLQPHFFLHESILFLIADSPIGNLFLRVLRALGVFLNQTVHLLVHFFRVHPCNYFRPIRVKLRREYIVHGLGSALLIDSCLLLDE